MKLIIIILLFFSKLVFAEDIEYREPFTLKLPIDAEHYYEQNFQSIPYVYHGAVFLFSGENFGINVFEKNESIEIKYQKNPKKADVEFTFTQEKMDNNLVMILVIKNNTKKILYVDGLMTTPNKKMALKTSILPVAAGISGYESWPQPIIQLALRNIRLED